MIRRAARRLPNGTTNEGAGPPASFCVRLLSYFDDREPAMSNAGRVYCSAVEQELPESGHAGLGEESGGIFGSLSCPTQLPAPTSRSLQQTASRHCRINRLHHSLSTHPRRPSKPGSKVTPGSRSSSPG